MIGPIFIWLDGKFYFRNLWAKLSSNPLPTEQVIKLKIFLKKVCSIVFKVDFIANFTTPDFESFIFILGSVWQTSSISSSYSISSSSSSLSLTLTSLAVSLTNVNCKCHQSRSGRCYKTFFELANPGHILFFFCSFLMTTILAQILKVFLSPYLSRKVGLHYCSLS